MPIKYLILQATIALISILLIAFVTYRHGRWAWHSVYWKIVGKRLGPGHCRAVIALYDMRDSGESSDDIHLSWLKLKYARITSAIEQVVADKSLTAESAINEFEQWLR